MARNESDREDLMREATALSRRIELTVADEPQNVIAGFRAGDAFSIYFGPDPVFHFDAGGRLRRGFVDGFLIRTQGTTIARLERVRTPEVVELRRHDLSDIELSDFLQQMKQRLAHFCAAVVDDEFSVVKQVPSGESIVPDIVTHLERVLTIDVPLAPQLPGKR